MVSDRSASKRLRFEVRVGGMRVGGTSSAGEVPVPVDERRVAVLQGVLHLAVQQLREQLLLDDGRQRAQLCNQPTHAPLGNTTQHNTTQGAPIPSRPATGGPDPIPGWLPAGLISFS